MHEVRRLVQIVIEHRAKTAAEDNKPLSRHILRINDHKAQSMPTRYLEPGLNMLSGLLAEPVAGWAGLLSGNPDNVEKTRNALTYQPRTAEGKAGMNKLAGLLSDAKTVMVDQNPPVRMALEGYNALADRAGAVSPVLGAAVKTAPTALGLLAGPGTATTRQAFGNVARDAYANAGKVPAVRGPLAMQDGMIAWHGSPYKFDAFDTSKVGTGEGKQQQGIGAYIAESRAVGEKYADRLANMHGKDTGYLYQLEVPDESVAQMAYLEKPLRYQPDNVRAAMLQLLDQDTINNLRGLYGWESPDDAPMQAIMESMDIARGNNRTATAMALRDKGIPGVRYLDGGSRSSGGGTSNFVIFPGNEGLLKILDRQEMDVLPY